MSGKSTHVNLPIGTADSIRSRSTAVPGVPASEISDDPNAITPVGGSGSRSFTSVHGNGHTNSSARASSSIGVSSSSRRIASTAHRYFHSRRLKKEEPVDKPWLVKKDPREKWVTILPCIGLFLGLAICGLLVWQGLSTVVNHKYCPVLMEDWSNGFDESIWYREAEVGGYGNGQFEYTTKSEENSFVKDGMLYLRPTLQDETLMNTEGAVLNLTELGICSSQDPKSCVAINNRTNFDGNYMNPVKSARISTKFSKSIRYGRIEVEAKLPEGKWLWPAIWMLPVENTYGDWPASGEIDIVESRGNNEKYPEGGRNVLSSTLHWGPDSANDAWWRTNVKSKALHTTYAKKFHTFGIEWSENYIFTYVNSRLLTVLFTNFNQRLWERGNFPLANQNGTRYVDPWAKTGNRNTPFDHPFYLIMNVAVGSTNGWFVNGKDGKPWVDGSKTERRDFWDKRNEWLPTWKNEGAMQVKSVKMWQQCD